MNEGFDEIELLFHAALALPADERGGFIESRSAGNKDLADEVASLIRSFEEDRGFLEQPVFETGLNALGRTLENDLSGSVLGDYSILERIGVGGMGEVYRAVDNRLDRPVALKFLSDQFANDRAARRRLEKEARAAAALDHPNICAVYGLEVVDGLQFIVMQYIEGVTLSEHIRDRRVGHEEFLSLACQIAGAVAFAHSHGIIHRDLKPGNIMVTPAGHVRVLDFGLAKTVDPQKDATGDSSIYSNTGLIVGTVSYMSPEQLRGEKLDFRSDIFSLGIILCEILSGENPFARPTQAETIAAILNSAGSVASGLESADLRPIVESCLRPKRADRPGSAEEVLNILAQVGSGRPLPRRLGAAIGMIAVVTVIAVFIGVGWFSWSRNVPRRVSVAILPIKHDITTESQLLGDGIRRRIGEKLANLSGLSLKNESQTARYQGKQTDPVTAGRELGVDAVLACRVQRTDSGHKLFCELIRVFDGEILRSSDDEIEPGNVAGVTERLTALIIDRIRLRLSADDEIRMELRRKVSPEAEARYISGRFLLNRRVGDDLERAVRELKASVELSPDFAEAWAALANSYVLGSLPSNRLSISPREAGNAAKNAARKAREIDPELSEVYQALGMIDSNIDWNWRDAERNFRNAIRIDPEFLPPRLNLVSVYLIQGRNDEALAEANAARLVDPDSVPAALALANVHYYRREFQAMNGVLQPLAAGGNSRVTYIRSFYLLMTGQFDEAIRSLEDLGRSQNDTATLLVAAPLGYAYGRSGRPAEANRVLRSLDSHKGFVSAQEKAIIYLGLRRFDEAFRHLRQSCNEGFNTFPGIINSPLFSELERFPEFADLRKCANLD
jgi:serine/threonine-protein kinase